MRFSDMVRLYTGKDLDDASDKEMKAMEKKLKTSQRCPGCGFCYQYNRDISQLNSISVEGYNTVVVQVFCTDRYTICGKGFKCDFEQRTDASFDLDNCPECGKDLVFTVVAMNVDASGIVESFCPKCGKMISSGQPFKQA